MESTPGRAAAGSATAWRRLEGKWEAMAILEHLVLAGEFPERARLLSGLTLEQVTLRPEGASHSI